MQKRANEPGEFPRVPANLSAQVARGVEAMRARRNLPAVPSQPKLLRAYRLYRMVKEGKLTAQVRETVLADPLRKAQFDRWDAGEAPPSV